tara:strand:- start:152 stop:457 length:306 start_codon:yes stop_codon:yes gene_type:complete
MAFKMKNKEVMKLAKEAGNNRISPMKEDDDDKQPGDVTTYMRNTDGTSTQVNVKDTSSVLADTEAKKLEVMRTRIKTDPKFKDYKIKRDPVTGKLSYVKIK